MHVHARRALAAIVLTLAGLVWTAPSANAHTHAGHTARGCLMVLHNNQIGALDWQDDETCITRDNYWRGHLRDSHAPRDGHCVTVRMDGLQMARSCDSAGARFTFLDPQRDFRSGVRICLTGVDLCHLTWNENY